MLPPPSISVPERRRKVVKDNEQILQDVGAIIQPFSTRYSVT